MIFSTSSVKQRRVTISNIQIVQQCPYYKNDYCKAESKLFLTEKCSNFPDCIFRKYQRKIHECNELRKKIGEHK